MDFEAVPAPSENSNNLPGPGGANTDRPFTPDLPPQQNDSSGSSDGYSSSSDGHSSSSSGYSSSSSGYSSSSSGYSSSSSATDPLSPIKDSISFPWDSVPELSEMSHNHPGPGAPDEDRRFPPVPPPQRTGSPNFCSATDPPSPIIACTSVPCGPFPPITEPHRMTDCDLIALFEISIAHRARYCDIEDPIFWRRVGAEYKEKFGKTVEKPGRILRQYLARYRGLRPEVDELEQRWRKPSGRHKRRPSTIQGGQVEWELLIQGSQVEWELPIQGSQVDWELPVLPPHDPTKMDVQYFVAKMNAEREAEEAAQDVETRPEPVWQPRAFVPLEPKPTEVPVAQDEDFQAVWGKFCNEEM
ncbi:hypothetical protein EDC01DRAFT_757918 [Geopyxis carbonaria]|nr:hypothetical protein EDC01DRAFT_757918 [Geopyxis carbonaria]